MSSARSFGFDLPRLENGIVKIPAHLDDYPLFTGELDYGRWMNRVMTMTEQRGFFSVGLHDCYSKFWIDRYSELLDRLKRVGELWTCDQITNQVYLMDTSRARGSDSYVPPPRALFPAMSRYRRARAPVESRSSRDQQSC